MKNAMEKIKAEMCGYKRIEKISELFLEDDVRKAFLESLFDADFLEKNFSELDSFAEKFSEKILVEQRRIELEEDATKQMKYMLCNAIELAKTIPQGMIRVQVLNKHYRVGDYCDGSPALEYSVDGIKLLPCEVTIVGKTMFPDRWNPFFEIVVAYATPEAIEKAKQRDGSQER